MTMKQLLVTLAIVLVSSLAMAQTTTENYVKSTVYKEATTTGAVSSDHNKIETVQYFDGLGRPLQSIAVRAGGANQDVVTHIDYDGFGRQDKDWLPYVINSTGGQYQSGAENATKSYYYNATRYDADFTGLSQSTINPYSQKQLENSPLSRVQKQAAPGKDWKLGEGHEIEFAYAANTSSDNVRLFEVDITISTATFTTGNVKVFTPGLGLSTTNNGYYAAGELYKSIIKDENHSGSSKLHTTEEFKDKQGRVVLKRTYALVNNVEEAHDTYYVYDDYGNLSYVIPPKVDVSNGVDATELKELCYQYEYDHRNRLVEKQLPGKKREYIVYDKLDRPVLTYSSGNYWLFTKYDAFGRVAYTGETTIPSFVPRQPTQYSANTSTATFEARTSATTIDGTTIYYTNTSYPTGIRDIYTINYYDDYEIGNQVDFNPANGSGTWKGMTASANTKGLPTVSRVRVLTTDDWITTATYYDDKGRAWETHIKNEYLDTEDWILNKLDFVGNVLESRTTHQKTGHPEIITEDFYTYDHMNRLLTHEQEINGAKKELIVRNEYDELGQLIKKRVGADVPIISKYQNAYGITVSGTTTSIRKYTPSTQNSGLSTFDNFTDNGYISFKAVHNYYDLTVGLSYNDIDYFSNSIDYAINLGANGMAQVYENDTAKGTAVAYYPEDGFKVECRNNKVYYSKNSEVFYVSNVLTNGNALVGDTAFTSYNGAIENFIIVNTDVSLQEVDYAYNIRGWLKNINEDGVQDNDLFNFSLRYNDPNIGTALYNGNISQTLWNTTSTNTTGNPVCSSYIYGYDALNRIVYATDNVGNYALSNLSYDKNGNILTLSRLGHINSGATSFGTMDDLTYSYDAGNKLLKVSDAGNDTYGFKDGINTGDDYTYDTNGNMLTDANKGISANIAYNHLNLPTTVPIGSGAISYIYDATGVKQEKKVIEYMQPTKYTYYAGNYVYEGDNTSSSLKFMNHPEGYVEPSPVGAFDYIYQYKDHLGNVRLSYKGEDDLLFYEDFESASGWNGSGHSYGSPISGFDNNFKHTGDYSGLVEPYGNGNSTLCYSNDWVAIDNAEPTDYIVSGWVYLEDVPGNSSYIRLTMKRSATTNSVFSSNVYTSTKGEWVYLEKRVTVPADRKYIGFSIQNLYAGKAWYDDLAIRKATDSPDLEILEENNYYPFGLKHKGYNSNIVAHHPYKEFQDQELTEDLGLNVHEWKYRISDPAIGRFWQIDPLAEDYVYNGTYNFSENRVIDAVELEGLEAAPVNIGYGMVRSQISEAGGDLKKYDQQNFTYGMIAYGTGLSAVIVAEAGLVATGNFLLNEAKDEILSRATGGASDFLDLTKMAYKGLKNLGEFGFKKLFGKTDNIVKSFDDLAGIGKINPSDVKFSQGSISKNFKDGISIEDLTKGLKNGSISPNDVPAIRIVEKDGKIFTLDNRRLKAFQDAGVDINYKKLDEIPKNEQFKFKDYNSGKTDGTNIIIRN